RVTWTISGPWLPATRTCALSACSVCRRTGHTIKAGGARIMSQTAQFPAETSTEGTFVRQPYTIRDRITADGSSGFRAEPGRYHLYVSLACPWAHRAVIVRRLLALEPAVSMSVVDPIRDEPGWASREGPEHGRDPIGDVTLLSDEYLPTAPP